MKYQILRTELADEQIRRIILFVAEKFGADVALEKLNEMESAIADLANNPGLGTEPRYAVLRRKGYRVLILEKDLVFYKTDEANKTIMIYAVADQRQDYLRILQGL